MALKMLGNMLRTTRTTSSLVVTRWKSSNTEKKLTVYDPYVTKPQKNKETYLEVIRMFEGQDIRRRGHVEFIYASLARMKEFGVEKDLEVYKALVDVLPKGKFIPTNIFQAEFLHYPKQQQCAVDLLEQMEDNSVMPDSEMEEMLMNIFGRRGIPLRKFWRMMYWMPKFKNLSPWYLPEHLPNDTMELAMLAIQRITSVDPDTKISIWQTEEIEASLDKTWIVSAQSRMQQVLLEEQPPDEPLAIKGPYSVYLRDQVVTYFILLGKIRPEHKDDKDLDDVSNIEKPPGIPGFIGKTTLPAVKCTVHEQDDGTIVAVCATGTSSRDSLLSWIRLLEKYGNPVLSDIPVIFTLIAPPADIAIQETQPAVTDDKETTKS
ncbi:PREDICTED: evolutionarily conserved signaling intermediate in Toll pathway, mitochondrial [Papilio xuthus]|uniref:Evolutionarily conserved signaling intermediate in Toll pathway, mitochondrial n=1 Tax=Papilio xuthus TaxID=66420 RepID=A0A194PIV7_PAPXU|nr:PREDICTED: evolutionarily conserved signaling intermediate in Toll pathway, mitochondrial [Papilio xuthus]KPI92983.1 Evolutionarily conserved signaling intermediate in Toll pathway, mitochondrial [Papilio xuthus]